MRANEDLTESLSADGPKFSPLLYTQRYQKVRDILSTCPDITKIADFGCAEGKFLRFLKKLSNVEEISCIDCNDYCLEQCIYESRPLAWDFIFGRSKELNINVYKGSVAQTDSRLIGYDAITCIELIEHLTPDVLSKLPENIFGFIKPKIVIITTPNIEFNVLFPQLKESSNLRHWDHKFEWTRQQFQNWCQKIVTDYPQYSYEITGVGEPPIRSKHLGYCTQISIFKQISSFNKVHNVLNSRLENHFNYELIDSFHYEKNTDNNSKNVEPIIDWDLILNSDKKEDDLIL